MLTNTDTADRLILKKYVEAPTEYDGPTPSLFLAGGITGCPNWQTAATELLIGVPAVVLNPRRKFFTDEPGAAEQQIRWEYEHLRRADVVLFWFCEGPSVQPIAMYELGAMAESARRIVVGTHHNYARRLDVRTQLALRRPDIVVYPDLASTVAAAAREICRVVVDH